MYEIVERGFLEVSEPLRLKTYSVVGKYNKHGILEKFPSVDVNKDQKLEDQTKNPKWDGFKLIK